MAEVKLHGGWASPFSNKVVWALKLKGIPYEYIEEDLYNKSASLLKYNPVHKMIPVLVHGEKPVFESMVILEYIEEMWPHNPSLMPSDPYDRAQARFWIKFAEDKGVAVWKMFFSTGQDLENAMKAALEMLQTVEKHGPGEKKFFNGDDIGLANLAFGAIAYWLQVLEDVMGVNDGCRSQQK
ncbi:glutathione s-transferase u8 [Citrus sinensis]|nr:glutathione s-transferase u8 [Citrus sinensis]